MDNDDILALTGGLPPSAFQLNSPACSDSVAARDPHDCPRLIQEDHDSPIYINDMFVIGPYGFYLNTSVHPTSHSANERCIEQQPLHLQEEHRCITNMVQMDASFIQSPPERPMSTYCNVVPRESGPISEEDVCSSEGAQKRFRPSQAVREILEEHFLLEPNPSKNELDSIAQKTKMTYQRVRTWFRNKRRRIRPEGNKPAAHTFTTANIVRSGHSSEAGLQRFASAHGRQFRSATNRTRQGQPLLVP